MCENTTKNKSHCCASFFAFYICDNAFGILTELLTKKLINKYMNLCYNDVIIFEKDYITI